MTLSDACLRRLEEINTFSYCHRYLSLNKDIFMLQVKVAYEYALWIFFFVVHLSYILSYKSLLSF